MEYVSKVGLTLLVVLIAIVLGRWVVWLWSTPVDASATLWSLIRGLNPFAGKVVIRDSEAIRQGRKVVGRVVGEVTEESGVVVFDYIAEARDINRLEPFDYQGRQYKQLSVELVATVLVTRYGTLRDVLKNVRCRIVE